MELVDHEGLTCMVSRVELAWFSMPERWSKGNINSNHHINCRWVFRTY